MTAVGSTKKMISPPSPTFSCIVISSNWGELWLILCGKYLLDFCCQYFEAKKYYWFVTNCCCWKWIHKRLPISLGKCFPGILDLVTWHCSLWQVFMKYFLPLFSFFPTCKVFPVFGLSWCRDLTVFYGNGGAIDSVNSNQKTTSQPFCSMKVFFFCL